ncbi:hypothetical protein [Deinococcus petrolearius]|uniref:Uncharacterized protein n=1 Tax=Deinococcus petrolearius TaxID=1751295 RepID=A0ABW1DD93_9DEIO
MPKTQTATPAFVTQLTLPRDGEAIDAGDINSPSTDLLGNTLYLYGLIAEQQRTIDELVKARGGITLTTPGQLLLEPGRTYTYADAIGIGRVDGYAGSVDLAALDVPAGVTLTFGPDPAPGASSTLTVTVAPEAVAGTYNITLTGTGPDGKSARTILPAVVAGQTQRSSFTFDTARTGSVDRAAGKTAATFVVAVQRQGNFADPINLSVTNLPAGITATWSKNPATGNGALEPMASVLTLTVGASVPAGTYNLNVRAEGGGVVRTQGVALAVTSAATGTDASYTLETVYDAGDPLVVNGATVYVNRTGGYTGPVTLSVGQQASGPVILVNGQPWTTTVAGNTARITADGASRGLSNSGVAPLPNSYSGSATYGLVRGEAVVGGVLMTRFAALQYRWGNKTYGAAGTSDVVTS